MKHLRAMGRVVAALGILAVTVPLQRLIAGPLFKDNDTIPHLTHKAVNRLMGIEINVKGDIVKDRQMIYAANHISIYDPFMLGSLVKGAFVSMAALKGYPLIGGHAKGAGSIFVRNGRGEKDDIPDIHRQLAENINRGRNIAVFPEGTVTHGEKIATLKQGILSVLFNNLSSVELEQKPEVQPLLFTITHVNGKPVADNPALKDAFKWANPRNPLKRAWEMLGMKDARVELQALDPVDPNGFQDTQSFADHLQAKLERAFY